MVEHLTERSYGKKTDEKACIYTAHFVVALEKS